MSNLLIEYLVCGQPDSVQITVSLQIIINLRLCECGIASKAFSILLILVSLDDRFQNLFPTISTMDITRAKQHSFTIPELIEAEQWMETGTPEMTVVG